jgi:hypothetical protein
MKGPKHEIFEHGVFTQIRSVWIGDLGSRPKNVKSISYVWGLILPFISRDFCFSVVGASPKNFFELRRKTVNDCFYIHLNGLRRFFVKF